MTTSIGKTLRLARLFDPDTGTSVMLPMDHANEEPDYMQLEHPAELTWPQLASTRSCSAAGSPSMPPVPSPGAQPGCSESPAGAGSPPTCAIISW